MLNPTAVCFRDLPIGTRFGMWPRERTDYEKTGPNEFRRGQEVTQQPRATVIVYMEGPTAPESKATAAKAASSELGSVASLA
jgi:hypothetical protein